MTPDLLHSPQCFDFQTVSLSLLFFPLPHIGVDTNRQGLNVDDVDLNVESEAAAQGIDDGP